MKKKELIGFLLNNGWKQINYMYFDLDVDDKSYRIVINPDKNGLVQYLKWWENEETSDSGFTTVLTSNLNRMHIADNKICGWKQQ